MRKQINRRDFLILASAFASTGCSVIPNAQFTPAYVPESLFHSQLYSLAQTIVPDIPRTLAIDLYERLAGKHTELQDLCRHLDSTSDFFLSKDPVRCEEILTDSLAEDSGYKDILQTLIKETMKSYYSSLPGQAYLGYSPPVSND